MSVNVPFKPGDRVVLSPLGEERLVSARHNRRGNSLRLGERGTVHSVTRNGLIMVVRDGYKTPSTYHPDFWRVG